MKLLKTWQAGPVDAPKLLFVHGWACTHDTMKPLVSVLSADYHCYSVDLLGHGESPKSADYSIAAQCSAIEATFAGMMEEMVVIGHSMGGQIALELAARGKARSAVLLDPAHILPHSGAIKWGKAQQQRLAQGDIPKQMDQFARSQFHYRVDPVLIETLAATMQATDPDAVRSAWDGIISYDGASALRRLEVPVLTVFADAPLNDGRAMARASKHIHLAQTACSGHMQQYDASAQVTAMIERFLAVHS
jgi:pimeloyl-ACP methyl ester carboxylesterase